MSDGCKLYFDMPPEQGENITAQTKVTVTEPSKKLLDQTAEELGFSTKSEAYRYFLMLGARAFVENNPRTENKDNKSNDNGYDSLTLRDVLPTEKDKALNMRESEVIDEIDKHVLDEVYNDPKISMEGRKVWLDQ